MTLLSTERLKCELRKFTLTRQTLKNSKRLKYRHKGKRKCNVWFSNLRRKYRVWPGADNGGREN